MPFPPQVCCHFRLRLDLTFHLLILVTAAEGQGSTKDASLSTLGVREEITAITDIPPQLSSLAPVTNVAIDGPSKRSLVTEHIEQRPPYAVVVEHSAISHTPSSDVEVPSSPTLGLPIGMLLPLNSAVTLSEHAFRPPEPHSQIPDPAASSSSRSWDPSAAVEELS